MISQFMVSLKWFRVESFSNRRLIFQECPGLAEWDTQSGMEVKNPMFSEETPATKTDKAQAPTSKTSNQK